MKNMLVLLIMMVLFAFPTSCFSEDYWDFYNADSVISDACQGQWPDNYQMQEFCINAQKKAVKELSEGNTLNLPDDIFGTIRNKCGEQWPDNYQMRRHCEKAQVKAWKNLNE